MILKCILPAWLINSMAEEAVSRTHELSETKLSIPLVVKSQSEHHKRLSEAG